jgi:mannosyltransferase
MPTDDHTGAASAPPTDDSRTRPGVGALLPLAAGVLVAALAMRLTGLGVAAVSLDEVYTQFAASRDWAGMVIDRASRGHMPTYFALVKATVPDVADPIALRLPSALADAAAAAILAAGIGRVAGLPAGLWAGALYATGPAFVIWAQNARPYGLLMALVAVGLVAAMAMVRQRGEGRPARLAFAAGWAGAVFTLTGGILAYLAVVLTPRVAGRLGGQRLTDAGFRRRWRRAAVFPSVVAGLAYLAVSRPHVYEGGVGGFWVAEYRPFGVASLAELGGDLLGGRLRHVASVHLTQPVETGLLAAMALAVAALAVAGGRRVRDLPALWPVIGLAVGFTFLMVAASVVSSLLLDRYFLPAWAAVLALAGIGLARLPGLAQAAIGGALVAVSTALALASALADPDPGPQYGGMAAAIEGSGHGDARILAGAPFTALRRDILSLRLDAPELPRPDFHGDSPERVARALEAGAPAFLAVSPAEWRDVYRTLLPPAPCGLETEAGVLVWLGEADCPTPLAPLGG